MAAASVLALPSQRALLMEGENNSSSSSAPVWLSRPRRAPLTGKRPFQAGASRTARVSPVTGFTETAKLSRSPLSRGKWPVVDAATALCPQPRASNFVVTELGSPV
jgi:hypothetical protein